jgi:hypothetical protein
MIGLDSLKYIFSIKHFILNNYKSNYIADIVSFNLFQKIIYYIFKQKD